MNRKPNFLNALLSVLVGLTLILSAVQPVNVSASASLVQGDGIRREVHSQTGKLSFLGADPSSPLRVSAAMGRGLAPEARGSSILKMYGSEFGIQDAARELSVMKSSTVDDRLSVRYQQMYNDIPVMAGELIVNMKADGSLLSINGEVSPNLNLDIQPKVSAAYASRVALQTVVTTYNLKPEELTVGEPELWIFDERLMQDKATQPVHLVWRMEVTSRNAPLRELVLVNAQTSGVSLHFNQIDTVWAGEPSLMSESRQMDDVSDPLVASEFEPVSAPSAGINMPIDAPNPADIDRYVANGGDDGFGNNNCSSSNTPCATIRQAISQAQTGDIIAVAQGTYVYEGEVQYELRS
jgi:bacillolysin